MVEKLYRNLGHYCKLLRRINMFVVFTEPKKFTTSYKEACQIADAHYNITGEIVAVENSSTNIISFPSDH